MASFVAILYFFGVQGKLDIKGDFVVFTNDFKTRMVGVGVLGERLVREGEVSYFFRGYGYSLV